MDKTDKEILDEYTENRKRIYEKFHEEQKTRKLNVGGLKFSDIPHAVDWLRDHPMFWNKEFFSMFHECFSWDFVLVNPQTEMIERDRSVNTEQRCWIECGPFVYVSYPSDKGDTVLGGGSHDIDLDVGDKTFELAVLRLAERVYQKYGDYEENY